MTYMSKINDSLHFQICHQAAAASTPQKTAQNYSKEKINTSSHLKISDYRISKIID